MRTKLSTCLRKQRFATRDEALAAALAASIPLRPYRCDRCIRFHLSGRMKGAFGAVLLTPATGTDHRP